MCADSSGVACPVPTPTQIFGIATLDDVDRLTTSATLSQKVRNFIPVPPFLVDVVFQANGNVKVMLLNSIKAIKQFDTDHAGDDEYDDKAKTKCKEFVFWLYLVHDESPEIHPVPVSSCTDELVASILSKVTRECLSPAKDVSQIISDQVERSLKRPFEVLASSSASTTDFMERLTSL